MGQVSLFFVGDCVSEDKPGKNTGRTKVFFLYRAEKAPFFYFFLANSTRFSYFTDTWIHRPGISRRRFCFAEGRDRYERID